jgi:malate dehydrogenase (oxaloacetate-decarboxylating)
MAQYQEIIRGNAKHIQTSLRGTAVLDHPLLNKSTAFSDAERTELGLVGLLPPHVEDISQQAARRYEALCAKPDALEKHIYLRALQDTNETLFYRLMADHIEELMPLVYTPTVGLACQKFSHIYRRPRGLFISYPQRHRMTEMLANRPMRDVDVVVVTDGERILGLGDQGVGGMGIPVGKLSLYTACGGINPARTLPIQLDVGTNNPERIADPLYLGWKHERIRGADYDSFIEQFVNEIQRQLPGTLLQWEDFANPQAFPILARYQDRLCSFNDDIQGTAAVTLGAILAALRVTGGKLAEQRIVLLGAGSAGAGICQLVLDEMVAHGTDQKTARRQFWSLDSKGLVYHGRGELTDVKAAWARDSSDAQAFSRNPSGHIELAEVVRQVKPTILIGVSAQPGSFSESVVREMAAHTPRPIILPLSNPTSKCEAIPADLIAWTDGRALVATGSPFADVTHNGTRHVIGQCNNSYIFPGVGLGVVAVGARRVTNEMFLAAARALAESVPLNAASGASLLPRLADIKKVSTEVAVAAALKAAEQGHADTHNPTKVRAMVEATWWDPNYVPVTSKPT